MVTFRFSVGSRFTFHASDSRFVAAARGGARDERTR